jgi:hypothetical protein
LTLFDIRLPRELEADGSAAAIRRVLSSRTAMIRPGGTQEVPVIAMSASLEQALVRSRSKGQIRYGFEAIRERLASEKKGIMNVLEQGSAPYGNRISRLILFSDDGAGRLYRHIEQLLLDHGPRILGCLLDVDSGVLGSVTMGKDRPIKVVLAEHKEAVSDLLRAMIAGPAPTDP